MASIRDLNLTFGPIPPRIDHVHATVTGFIDFTEAEIADEQWFRLSVELRASDAEEGGWDFPLGPLHTFVWGPWAPFLVPYSIVKAQPGGRSFEVDDDISLEALDEDPGTERGTIERRIGGQTYRLPATFRLQDEVYAFALITGLPGSTAQSEVVAVPWSDRRIP